MIPRERMIVVPYAPEELRKVLEEYQDAIEEDKDLIRAEDLIGFIAQALIMHSSTLLDHAKSDAEKAQATRWITEDAKLLAIIDDNY